MHIVESVDFWLDVEAVSSIGVENFGTGRRRIVLALSRFVVVVVMLSLVVNLMVDIVDRVGEGIQVFFLMLLGHVRVVFLLFEPHLNWYTTAMEEGLTVEVLNR